MPFAEPCLLKTKDKALVHNCALHSNSMSLMTSCLANQLWIRALFYPHGSPDFEIPPPRLARTMVKALRINASCSDMGPAP